MFSKRVKIYATTALIFKTSKKSALRLTGYLKHTKDLIRI